VLPELAAAIKTWFPELGGRCLAVSEIEPISSVNMPKLPLCCVALVKEKNQNNIPRSTIKIEDQFIIEFWFEKQKYKRSDGSESPFYSYFDYETLRDKLLHFITNWVSPSGGTFQYVALQCDSTAVASCITFTFSHIYDWCDPVTDDTDGKAIDILTFCLNPNPEICLE
jgi:hypothetical protein